MRIWERIVAEMSELLAVRDKLNVSVRELSLGERTKMELIASLAFTSRKFCFWMNLRSGSMWYRKRACVSSCAKHNAQQKTTIFADEAIT